MLEGRRLLITGVLTEDSIAYAVAERAQAAGAEVVLTGFGRGLRITERIARRLPSEPPVLELDVNDPAHLEAVAADLEERWGALDGVLHAIAFAPEDALGGSFLTAPAESAELAFRTSAFSLKALAAVAGAAARARRAERRDRRPRLRRHASRGRSTTGWAWPRPRWSRSTATSRATSGARGVRSNLVAAGPIRTMAARSHPRLRRPRRALGAAGAAGLGPARPGPGRRRVPVPASPLARAVTGEIAARGRRVPRTRRPGCE